VQVTKEIRPKEMDDKYARIGDLKRLVTQKREIKDLHYQFRYQLSQAPQANGIVVQSG